MVISREIFRNKADDCLNPGFTSAFSFKAAHQESIATTKVPGRHSL